MIPEHPEFLVSIHCMTYNQAVYITDAMNGFSMQQTTFPFLAIICDDASTDGEQEVIRQYLDKHFMIEDGEGRSEWTTDESCFVYSRHCTNANCYFLVIFLKENYYSQRKNKQHLWAEWEVNVKYIAHCEGDDYWIASDKLQNQVGYMERVPNCSYLFTHRKVWSKGAYTVQYDEIRTYGTSDILIGMVPGLQTVIHRNNKDAQNYAIQIKGGVGGDIKLPYAFLQVGEIHCLAQVTAVYRITGEGVCTCLSLEKSVKTAIRFYYEFHEGLGFPRNDLLRRYYQRQLRRVNLSFVRSLKVWNIAFFLDYSYRYCPTAAMKCRLTIGVIKDLFSDLGIVILAKFK